MTNPVREAIRENTRLARMRQGQLAPEMIDIPSMPGIRAAQVPLTEAEVQRGLMRASTIDVPDNAVGFNQRNRACIVSDVFHSLREPSEVGTYLFETIEEMEQQLDGTDIDYLSDNLTVLISYASPEMEGMTEEAWSELKKAFGEIELSGLTGQQWAAVKLVCLAVFPGLLAANSYGLSSIESLMPKTESDESI